MRNFICILTFCFYSIGSLILPASDFSLIPELGEMYSHCKATEDKDMNLADFITDHLMNIDGIFDHHENGDEQKPHQPFQHQAGNSIVFIQSPLHYQFRQAIELRARPVCFSNKEYYFDFVGDVFRPPIA